MAIVEIAEVWQNREATYHAEKLQRNYTKYFQVLTASSIDSEAQVARAVLDVLGGLYVPYSSSDGFFDLAARLTQVQARNKPEAPYVWMVQVDYTTLPLKQSGNNSNKDQNGKDRNDPNPTNRPAKVTWKAEKRTEPVKEDTNGNPITNVLFEEFTDPAPTKRWSRPVLECEINLPESFDPFNVIRDYHDSVNSDTFLGEDPGTWLLTDITANFEEENQVFFWKVSLSLMFDPDGWKLRLLNKGYNWLNPDNAQIQMWFDPKTGLPPAKPILLTQFGAPLDLTKGDQPFFVEFDIYDPMPFGVLGIPQ